MKRLNEQATFNYVEAGLTKTVSIIRMFANDMSSINNDTVIPVKNTANMSIAASHVLDLKRITDMIFSKVAAESVLDFFPDQPLSASCLSVVSVVFDPIGLTITF